MKNVMVLFLCLLVWLPVNASAQIVKEFESFGKNKVVYEKSLNNFYQSEHFEIWHSLNLRDISQKEFFEEVLMVLENAYLSLSQLFDHEIKEKVPIMIYMTHSEFESTNIIAEFLPEGVGAFVEHERNRMVLKSDFSPPLMKSIVVHELVHSFQFSILKRNVLNKMTGTLSLPRGFIEGGAEFIASLFVPHTRDDLRRINQRTDAGNPEFFLPTWENFMSDQADPYAQWEMVFEFLEEKYGVGIKFKVQGLKKDKNDLGKLITELTQGDLTNPKDNPELFDRKHRDFWGDKYAENMRKSQRPYEKEKSFDGINITPKELPFGILSFALSPDGKETAVLSPQKNGISIMLYSLSSDTKSSDTSDTKVKKIKKKIKNLTPDFPPNNFEYIVSQRGNTWPFNGSDIAWSKTERKIAYFARKGKDHSLFLSDADHPGRFQEVKIPYDQAFSPVFSQDGGKIYFSASKNIARDIYELDLKTFEFLNLTHDSNFDTAPSVSPDGKLIAYVAFDGDFQKLFLLDLETMEKRQITFNRHNDDSPHFLDSSKIIYTSDERNSAWNICTIDIETNEVKQWTEFFGGAFTPKPIPNSGQEIVSIVFWPYDQFKNQIYKNFEIYRLKLTEPIDSYVMKNKGESMIYAFRSFHLFLGTLDENQIRNPIRPPQKWHISEGEGSFGLNNYWGAFGYGTFNVSDITENNIYSAGYAFSGNTLRLINFSYLNQAKRLNWGYGFYNHKLPLSYLHWNIQKGYPDQFVLNRTLGEETGTKVFARYPLSKFSRVEIALGFEKRNFEVWIGDRVIADSPEYFTDTDRQFFNFFKKSKGQNANFAGAYVRDTVLYSNTVQGPIHGNAFRANFEISHNYSSLSIDYRRYKRISNGSLLAFRFAGLRSSRPTGDYVLLGGDSTLRAYPYGFIAGNQIVYGSAEFRFPVLDAVVFPGRFGIGPFRGFLFADYALARFSNEKFSAQEGASFGPGINFMGFNFVWAWRKIDGFKGSKKDFYISRGWNF